MGAAEDAAPALLPCAEAVLAERDAPLSYVTRLRAPPLDSEALTVAVVSGVRARDPRLGALTRALNDSAIDATLWSGGALSAEGGAGEEGRLSALARPWFALPTPSELRAVGLAAWAARFGDPYVTLEAGETRLVALSVAPPFDGSERLQVSRWGGDAPLVWRDGPAPRARLLLTPTPLSTASVTRPLEARAPLIRFLDEVSASGFRQLLTVGAQEPHHGLELVSLPSFGEEGGEWVELRLALRCPAEGGCLTVTPRRLPPE
ncbi:MAG: hypothetical protein FJ138_18935 [Deltaproteobacteria bacterium]|nr:hypothetical protein [Deltaproteobacteria bacterium]